MQPSSRSCKSTSCRYSLLSLGGLPHTSSKFGKLISRSKITDDFPYVAVYSEKATQFGDRKTVDSVHRLDHLQELDGH